ncbi:MAG: sugar phosphate nucleotidyltransferase [Candidatus Bathyarchaeota archaeon]|jgi:bifunctional UDP-N-acetylglucosamine pyrophosphorylase/glucosamine-1-phosphate N-acetyltransferase
MKAVVLAAGRGERLQPFTLTRPKHLIKIGGTAILEHCLKKIRSAGVNEVILVVHYMADKIKQYFYDGEKFGIRVSYVEQKETSGTGNAVCMVEEFIQDDFLLVYGDLLFNNKSVKDIIDFHTKDSPSATMAVTQVENPEDYGIVEVQNGSYVSTLIEKPPRNDAPSNLANAGIYVLSPEIFDKLKEVAASPRGELEITDAISNLLNAGEKVAAVQIPNNDWVDVGKPWDLLRANQWILARREMEVHGKIESGVKIVGSVSVAKTARVRSGTYIEGPVLIDDDCDVGPNSYIRPYTSIGRGTRVGNACEIKNSIIMDNVHIGHLSYVGDSVVGERSNLGAGTITANLRHDSGKVKVMVKEKIIDSGRKKLGAFIGDDVKAGINTLFMPGVKIGIGSLIGPNVVVYRDVQSNTMVTVKQNLEEKKLGS